MPDSESPALAFDEILELNRLFLEFLRQRSDVATLRFGLSSKAAKLLQGATPDRIDHAARFPRALFRLRLPEPAVVGTTDRLDSLRNSRERVLELVILFGARNLCRQSGYAARLLLGLGDGEVGRLRRAEVSELVEMSLADGVLGAAFDELDWVWQELLTDMRPEAWRHLLLVGFQPDFPTEPLSSSA